MLRNVAVVVVNGFLPFEFGTICEVFGVDRADDRLPGYDFAVVAGEPPPVRAHNDFTIHPSCGLERLEEADLIALPAVDDDRLSSYVGQPGPDARQQFPEDLLAALRRAVDRGARVLSVCTGAFILGEAGLLDGRRCTTHWRNAEELARRYPQAKVDPDVLYVDDDPVITSAGTAAGIDACLYLVRKEQGSRIANGIARRMVVPPHRDGGQAQYVDQPVAPSCDGTLRDLLEWLRAHLDQPLTVRQLAVRANMSERTFARRFVQDTGTTPQRWLIGQRILLAQQLLEESDETVDAIADRAGFGNATALRHHFRAWRGTTPHAYRRLFRGDPAGGTRALRKRRKLARRFPAAGARTTGHCFYSARYRGQLPCGRHGVTVHDNVIMSGNRGKTDVEWAGGVMICASSPSPALTAPRLHRAPASPRPGFTAPRFE